MERSWPLRELAARPIAIYGVIAGGIGFAGLLPVTRPGIGWLLAGTVVVAVFAVVVASSLAAERRCVVPVVDGHAAPGELVSTKASAASASSPRPVGWEHVGWAVATLALLGVGTVRAAGWLFALCALAACVTGALAVGRGRTCLGVFFALVTPPVAAGRGVAWLARAAARRAGGRRTSDSGSRGNDGGGRTDRQSGGRTDRQSGGRMVPGSPRVAGTLFASVVLVVVFGALFASADPTFAHVVDAGAPDLSVSTVARWCLLAPLGAAVTLAGAFLLVNPTRFGDLALPPPRPLRRFEWALPIGALVALFGLFIGVQFAALFGGRDYVMRTAGLTFAQYARRGFWQLLVVTLLTLLVLAVAIRKAPRESRSDRVLLRVLLGALACCALLIVGSALRRMWLYEQAFGFSRLRVTVSAVELWLGLQFALVIAAGVRLRAGWLPRTVIASGVVVLLGLAALNPDRFIAAQNVDRYQRTQKIDVSYLRGLSADAAVELDRLPSPLRECALVEIAEDLRRADQWREYNVGREAARDVQLPEPDETWAYCQSG